MSDSRFASRLRECVVASLGMGWVAGALLAVVFVAAFHGSMPGSRHPLLIFFYFLLVIAMASSLLGLLASPLAALLLQKKPKYPVPQRRWHSAADASPPPPRCDTVFAGRGTKEGLSLASYAIGALLALVIVTRWGAGLLPAGLFVATLAVACAAAMGIWRVAGRLLLDHARLLGVVHASALILVIAVPIVVRRPSPPPHHRVRGFRAAPTSAVSATDKTDPAAIPVSTARPGEPVSTVRPGVPASTAQPGNPVSTARPGVPVSTARPGVPASTASAAATTLGDLPRPQNVVMIVIDTLRADHLSSYGYPVATSPEIDRLARSGVTFSNAIVQFTRTSPSVASILTGTYPYTHRLWSCRTSLPEWLVTLPEVLKAAGFRTASFVANPNLGRTFHFDQGFEHVEEIFLSDGLNDASNVNRKLLPWLDAHARDRFFLYVQYFDPHAPYAPPAPYRGMFKGHAAYQRYRSHLPIGDDYVGSIHRHAAIERGDTRADLYVERYDEEIRFVDSKVGELLARLRDLGIGDETLVVLTADHGESLGNHDFYFHHGLFCYEDTAHVPLIVRYPAALPEGRRVSSLVESVDLMPTVLELAGVPLNPEIEGKSLVPLLLDSGKGRRPVAYSEGGRTSERLVTSIREDRWKLIHNSAGIDPDHDLFLPRTALSTRSWKRLWLAASGRQPFHLRWELYDVVADPEERMNLVEREPDTFQRLQGRLEAWLAEAPAGRLQERPTSSLDEDTLKQLHGLGYVN